MNFKNSFKLIVLLLFIFAVISFSGITYKNFINRPKKLSIVLPVYNVSSYLPKCLDSLIYQTYDNLEIICVNDGSKDNSLEILNNYKEKDNRIIVINKENGGVSSARNAGIRAASGEYITFVDPDDYLDTNVYEKCLHSISEKNRIF